MNRVWVCAGLLVLVWFFNFAGASRPQTTFRVHVQTQGKDFSAKQAFPVQLVEPQETVIVSAVPELNETDIIGIQSWPAEDPRQGLAVKIQFDSHGTNSLSNMTIQDEGKVMVVFVNGRMVYTPIIDTVINSGVLTIPRGFLQSDVTEIEAMAKRKLKN